MGRAARRLGMVLAGGDTTKGATVSISITVLGDMPLGLAVRRSGARPGDILYVSGRLGRAELGLRMVQNGGPGNSSGRCDGIGAASAASLPEDSRPTRRMARAAQAGVGHDGYFGWAFDRSRPIVRGERGRGAALGRAHPARRKFRLRRSGLLRKLRLDPLQTGIARRRGL